VPPPPPPPPPLPPLLFTSHAGGPPPEKTITLAGIIAPRLGRHYAKEESGMKDEPWAWESKEMARKMCVGKPVSFRIEPSKGSTTRE
jgi:staphylococcal nuclease domain-containing protein 1